MFEINFHKLMDDLVSEDYEVQIQAFEDVSAIFSVLSEQCTKAFLVSLNPYLIAERLPFLGSRIITPLESFVGEASEGNSERKVLASIVLLSLGSTKGLEHVISELRESGKNEYLAANVLTKAKVPEAKDLIVKRLRKFSLEDLSDNETSVYISNLLAYLNELSVPLPEDLKERFEKVRESENYKYYSEHL